MLNFQLYNILTDIYNDFIPFIEKTLEPLPSKQRPIISQSYTDYEK